MLYHLIAFLIGFNLDLILGDPVWLHHPVQTIGFLIQKLDERLNNNSKLRGLLLVIITLLLTLFTMFSIIFGSYLIHPIVGIIVESCYTWRILALKSLKDASFEVKKHLINDDLEDARLSLSMIVGRDTENLNQESVIMATIETLAENFSDGVIAPMLYTFIGGPILGMTYKAINTMDSMIGYKNDKYINFGFCAAKLDDVFNFIPSRISAWLLLISCLLLGKTYDIKNGVKIFRRDRYKHPSPNSAQTESAMAGILNIRLGGPSYYFGKLSLKEYLGDPNKMLEIKDIDKAAKLIYVATFLLIFILVFFGGLLCLYMEEIFIMLT